MATATAPERSVAKPKRPEPREYTFRLTQKFPEFFQNSSPYPARLDLPTSGTILWPYLNGAPMPMDTDLSYDTKEGVYKSDKTPVDVIFNPRAIRYIAGAPSIFVDEQEKSGKAYERDNNGKNSLLDNDQNKIDLTFQNAEIRVPAYKRTLRDYLWCYNQCKNQYAKANDRGNKFRPTNPTYELIINHEKDERLVALGELRKKAMELAETARRDDMLPHSKWLNISFTHDGTDELRDEAAIRESYIEMAFQKPADFINSFSNPQIKLMYQIRNLLEGDNAQITFHKTAGQAHWISTGALITTLPPDKNPVEFLADFATTKEGTEFANNLRAFK